MWRAPPAANANRARYQERMSGRTLLLTVAAIGVVACSVALVVLVAAGATVVLVALIAARVIGIDSAARRTDTMICADHCLARGFAGSGMPPQDSGDRTCSCYDPQGEESVRVPIDEIAGGR